MLVLGATGMIGHRVVIEAVERGLDVVAAARSPQLVERFFADQGLAPPRLVRVEDLTTPGSVDGLLGALAPSVVVNAAGLVKQREGGLDPRRLQAINIDLPHALASRCAATGSSLIQLSTDCVFSGRRGFYGEADPPDPVDAYGRSKLAGEPRGERVTVLRTSMIGRQLCGETGLVEWLLGEEGNAVRGHRKAIFSGPTTPELARIVVELSVRPVPEGVLHVAAEPIDKHTLLVQLVELLGLPIEVEPVDEPVLDRSLDGAELVRLIGRPVASWSAMLEELAASVEPYRRWRSQP